jgi:hypothetical protein
MDMLSKNNLEVTLMNTSIWNEGLQKYEDGLMQFHDFRFMRDFSDILVKKKQYELTAENLRYAESVFASWLEGKFGKHARGMYEGFGALPIEISPETESIYGCIKDKIVKSPIDIAIDILTKQNQNINCCVYELDSPKGYDGIKITSWSGYKVKGPFSTDRTTYYSVVKLSRSIKVIDDQAKIDRFIKTYGM